MGQNNIFREEKKEVSEYKESSSGAIGVKMGVGVDARSTDGDVDAPPFQAMDSERDVQSSTREDSSSRQPSSTASSQSSEHKPSGAVESKQSFATFGSSGVSSNNSGGLLTYSENPRDMKVLRLREELKSRNLSPSGLKNALVDRLIKALQEEGYNTTGFATEDENSEHADEASSMFVGAWRYASFNCPDDDDFSLLSSRVVEGGPDSPPDLTPQNANADFRDHEDYPSLEHQSKDARHDEEYRRAATEEDLRSEQQLNKEILDLVAFPSESEKNLSNNAQLNVDHELNVDELKTLPLLPNPPSLCKLPARSFAAIYSSSTKKIYYISSKDWQVHSLRVQDKCSFRAVQCNDGSVQTSTGAPPSADNCEAIESKYSKRPCPSVAANREVPELELEGFSTTLQGTKIVIFGGSKKTTSHTVFYNTCHIYDTETSIWEKLNVKNDDCVPAPRDFHTACSIGTNEIMILGGRTSSKDAGDDDSAFECLNDVHILDTATWEWRPIVPEGHLKPRFGHTATYNPRHHSVFVHGGLHIVEKSDSSGNDGDVLDDDGVCEAKLWNEANERLEELADVAILNLDAMKWTTVDSLYGTGVLPRVHHTACLRNGKIFLYGGCNTIYGNFFIPNDVRYFEIDTLHWHKLASDKKPCKGRWGHSAFMINEEMIIMGGYLSEDESTKTVLVINTEYKPTVVICEDVLMSNLKQLLQSELFADINFRVQNKYLRAHKAIIACRSSQLRDLCNKKKKRGQTITLESIKYQTFNLFLQLLYYGRIIVDHSLRHPRALQTSSNQTKFC
ncbi:uncharacterized protein LOC126318278 isoform X2 [Schistocerca gregaria]|uniref:uncharacterized protein LOC126318278 isoform X2 n=1 Tax=Schistocerca gregaria TaxID=7010 RepID=UPI00211DE6BB|nr:uncharacterized protein LOC126318278 isoform X2 [Schistocerca gregaria]